MTEILAEESCVPATDAIPKLSPEETRTLLTGLDGWGVDLSGSRIVRNLRTKNFLEAMALFQQITDLAEHECHHPDLHLRNYRHVEVALWTHTVSGLSRNDFIMAAKIDKIISKLASQEHRP